MQRHSQGSPLSDLSAGNHHDWPVKFLPGERLANYWRLEEIKPGNANFYQYPDLIAHKNRIEPSTPGDQPCKRARADCPCLGLSLSAILTKAAKEPASIFRIMCPRCN